MVWLVAGALADPTRVVLVEAGVEPREALRYARVVAQSQRTVTRQHTVIALGGLPDPDPIDAEQTLVWRLAPEPGDGIHLRATLAVAELTTDAPKPPDLAPLVGHAGRIVLDDRGQLQSATWDAPPTGLSREQSNRLDTLHGAAEQIATLLPEEPVGVGAIWEVHRTLDARVVTLDIVTRYRLESREPEGLALSATATARGAPSEVAIDGDDGFTGKVTDLAVDGSYRLSVALDHAAPLAIDGKTTTHLRVKGWKGILPVSLTLDVSQTDHATRD
ncbi:MAG: hypothetical protein H6737_22625 [Alphaproteobacteria bacterium]|nr:hypothetical protein [Alphaproteobacteria bacterium]